MFLQLLDLRIRGYWLEERQGQIRSYHHVSSLMLFDKLILRWRYTLLPIPTLGHRLLQWILEATNDDIVMEFGHGKKSKLDLHQMLSHSISRYVECQLVLLLHRMDLQYLPYVFERLPTTSYQFWQGQSRDFPGR